jgi:hypothetical protein
MSYHLDLKKYPQNIPHIWRVGDDFSYKKQTWLTKKIILECSPHWYWGVWKKNQILAKTFHLLSSTWTLFFKLPQILGPIQVLANSLKQHDYNNLAFEVYVNKSLKIMYQKQIIIPIKSSTC